MPAAKSATKPNFGKPFNDAATSDGCKNIANKASIANNSD
jgi:hypothetical protein